MSTVGTRKRPYRIARPNPGPAHPDGGALLWIAIALATAALIGLALGMLAGWLW